jgi:hypothetical protein
MQAKVQILIDSVITPDDFDAVRYVDANPDVREAGVNPTRHFLEWGRLEGRLLGTPGPERETAGGKTPMP